MDSNPTEGKYGKILWRYDESGNVLYLTGKKRIPARLENMKPDWEYLKDRIRFIHIGEGIRTIGSCLFQNYENVTEVFLPDSLKAIEHDAFSGCTSLAEIEIPYGIRQIDSNAFDGCTSLKEISIPDGIEWLGPSVFRKCKSLEIMIIPEGIDTLEEFLFQDCSSLRSVWLPGSLKAIDYRVFCHTGIKDVYFGGTDQEWRNLRIEDENDELRSAVIHCAKSQTTAETASPSVYAPSLSPQEHAVIPDGYAKIGTKAILHRKISSVVIPDSVKEIGISAFESCDGLKSVEIPDTVTYIGKYAFSDIYALRSVRLPANLERIRTGTFENCPRLLDIRIPDGVSRIDGFAFSRCTALRKVHLPMRLKCIGFHAFQNCSSLETIVIPYGTEEIGESAFEGCTDLERIVLPGTLKRIGLNAFLGCDNLKHIYYAGAKSDWNRINIDYAGIHQLYDDQYMHYMWDLVSDKQPVKRDARTGYIPGGSDQIVNCVIPDGTEVIGDNAFLEYMYLTEAELPDSVRKIGESAFEKCRYLLKINLPKGLREIGRRAFSGCTRLEDISFPDSLEVLGPESFSFTNLESVDLPSGLKEIGEKAFQNSFDLTEIEIPGSVSVIEKSAFAECGKLEKAVLKEGVTEIGTGCFKECGKLKEVYLPESLQVISMNAFAGCRELEKIYYKGSAEEWKHIRIEAGSQLSQICILTFENTGDSIATELKSNSADIFRYSGAEDIVSYTVPDSVRAIGDFSFVNCTSLKSVILPADLIFIGESAFDGISLQEVRFLGTTAQWNDVFIGPNNGILKEIDVHCIDTKEPDGFVYKGPRDIERYVIPEGTVRIADNAFSDCFDLKEIIIPEGVESIGEHAFSHCSSLDNIQLPSTLKEIGQCAFRDCRALSSIRIPGSVRWIEAGTFMNCLQMNMAVLEYGVQYIDLYAFKTCTSLQVLVMTETVKAIGISAFEYSRPKKLYYYETEEQWEKVKIAPWNDGLEKVSVEYMQYGDPEEDDNEEQEEVSEEYMQYDDPEDDAVEQHTDSCYVYTGPKDVREAVIPEGTWMIGINAFENCYDLESVSIPYSVEMIGENAFKDCRHLKNIDYPGDLLELMLMDIGEGNDPLLRVLGMLKDEEDTSEEEIEENPAEETVQETEPEEADLDDDSEADDEEEAETDFFDDIDDYDEKDEFEFEFGQDSGYFVYRGERNIRVKEIPDGITVIGKNAFRGCTELETVYLPDSIRIVEENAFRNCKNLKTIGYSGKPSDLLHLLIDEGNEPLVNAIGRLSIQDDTDEDKKPEADSKMRMRRHSDYSKRCNSRKYKDDEICVINSWDKRKIVKVPKGRAYLSAGGFEATADIETLYLPNSLKEIEDDTFIRSRKLCDVYYDGTEEEWAKVEIGFGNVYLLKAEIHYSYSVFRSVLSWFKK